MKLFRFSWRHRGKTPDGNTIAPSGHVRATDGIAASNAIDAMLRETWPNVKWMHGRNVETDRVKYGPAVRQLTR